MADTVVQELVINTLTQAQFDAAKEAGTLSPYELYGTPDAKADNDLMNITDGAKELMANASMPSGTYINLTLGSSGTTYTAPADGWITLSKASGVVGGWIGLTNKTGGMSMNQAAPGSANVMQIYVPVKASDVVLVAYSATGTTDTFRLSMPKAQNI